MQENKNQRNQTREGAEFSKFNLTKVTKIGIAIYLVIAVILSTLLIIVQNQKSSKLAKSKIIAPELARAMTYEQFGPGSDDVYSTDGETKVDNVKFSAFFLRDLDGDGYAEKMMGTCKETGTSDTLYMEINVLTNGKLKNAKVEIDGKNFYLLTAIPKDQQIKNNAIGINTKQIEFNDMVNGTQKLFAGVVRSGNYIYNSSKLDALNNNISNYSRNDNKIILTGIYEDENGNETEIRKEVNLTMDWYGKARTTIQDTYQNYKDLDNRINEETQTINLSFSITTAETENKLLLSGNHVQATIPEFNGYKPTEVKVTSGNVNYNYDETTGILTIDRTATTDETGKLTKTVARDNTYSITVKYPLEAYQSIGDASVELLVPVEEYYEGYNNANTEFTNPYKSNIAKTIIRAVYNKYVPSTYGDSVSIYVGDYISVPYNNYVISKRKPMRIYNGVSTEEKDDTYKVQWYYYRGNIGEDTAHITLKETPAQQSQVSDQFLHVDGTYTSMEELTTNVGIYFNNLNNIISTDGEIKVYDEETGNLLLTVDKSSFNKYTSNNPYKFETSVKHIRVEAYGMLKSTNLTVTSIKELDDEYITTNFTEEEFNDLKQIKSTLNASKEGDSSTTVSRNALYELPTSVAKISLSKNVLSTQETEKNDNIIITAEYYESKNEIGWTNGIFQVKLPDEIYSTEINNVTIDNNNVKIDSYEYIENENGKFIKIYTNNNTPSSYTITIDCNLTPDPRIATTSKDIELYAYNEEGTDYYYKSEDIYDVNNNQNTTEKLNKTTTSISLVAPNSLLTNQTLSEFDEEGTVIVSPNTADVSIKNVNVETEEKTATIGVQIKNNYSSDISEVVILGKIPFEGNTTALTNQDLKSTFTTKMTDTGIEVPEALQGQVDVYYSENETPTKDLNNENNNWKTANEVENWDNIKTFLIDFKDSVLTPSQEYVFYYTVKIPNGTPYNEISNSHHGVYFALNTDEGKYRTQTEPNKIGIRIAEKYNVTLTKYQTSKEKLIPGATYSITDEEETTKTATTNAQGTLTFNKLYVEKTYEIKEIRSPNDYELNGEAIRFIAHVTETGDIEIEKLSGTTKGDITVATDPTTNTPTANIQTQDEAKAKLKIIKTEKGTETRLSRVSYKITGVGLPTSGRAISTNINGEANLKGLKIGQEYTISETKANGYYLNEPVKFIITNNNGNYDLQVTGENKANSITIDNEIPAINLELEDDKIPTYNLQINKIAKGSQTEQNPSGTPIQGAKFKLYKDEKEQGTYETDENGHITIEGLYQYEQTRNIDQTYKLVEIYAPEGYAKTTDVIFSSQTIEEVLQLNETIPENGKAHTFTVDGNTINLTIEDNPSFRLTKKDGETNELLPNTKFAIYNVEDGLVPARNSKGEILGTKETIDGKEYYTLITNENGQITADLAEGLYKAVEVQSDEKYDISNNTEYFGIGASREGKRVGQIEWGTSIGGNGDDYIKSVIETTDGGYLVGGYFLGSSIELENGKQISNHNSGYLDGMIIKYSKEGDVEWGKSVGGSDEDSIYLVTETLDGGYFVGGYFSSNIIDLGNGKQISNHHGHDGMLIKYSSEGECEWGRSIGGDSWDEIFSVIETTDGGCFVGGHFRSSSIDLGNGKQISNYESTSYPSNPDGMLIKYSSEGECEWGVSIGGNGYDHISSVTQIADGGYLVGGNFYSSSIDLGNGKQINNHGTTDYSDGMLIKYSNDGECEWGKSIGETFNDYINSVTETADEGYLVVGDFSSSSIDLGNGKQISIHGGTGYCDGMIIKYSSEGDVEWGKSIGGSSYDYIRSVTETLDEGYLVGGYFQSASIDLGNGKQIINQNKIYDSGSITRYYSDGMLIKYSRGGECEWGVSIGGINDDIIESVTEMQEGEYLVGGSFLSSSIDCGNGKQISNHGISSYGSTTYYNDGILIKLKEMEISEPVVKWGTSIGGTSSEEIQSIIETSDGGYLVGGYFDSNSIELGNGKQISNHNSGYIDGMIIKYSREGICEWGVSLGGSGYGCINSATETADEGYLVGGYFRGSINLGNGKQINSHGYMDGMIIKYSKEGICEWGVSIEGSGNYNNYINSVTETIDGGYLVVGHFSSSIINPGNGKQINNHGNYDGMLLKYSREGECEWGISIGGNDYDEINSITETADGGCLVGGSFGSSSIDLGNGKQINNHGSTGNADGMIIKYSAEGECEWGISIGASRSEDISSVTETEDGGYLVGGSFGSSSIDLGNGKRISNHGSRATDVMLIKYSREGECEWGISTGGTDYEHIYSVTETEDGGYLVGGDFKSSIVYPGNENQISNHGNTNYTGMLIKYSREGVCEWGVSIGTSESRINSVTETTDGGYIVGGTFYGSSIDLGNGKLISNHGGINYTDGMVLKVYANVGVPEQEEITVKNYRKQYRITTDVNEIDNVKGGSISGEDRKSYETVKYGDDSTKEIIMTPDENYEIIGITVNGEEWQFEEQLDGTYTMPAFENMTENKHVVVTYSLKDNKITINKTDSISGEKLTGAEFKLDKIEERTEPINEDIFGELTDSGRVYKEVDFDNEVTGILGDLTNNGSYYFVEQDGKYVPTNSRTYQLANGGTGGKLGTAWSYIPIDLSGLDGTYKVIVNANVSSRNTYDYGFATINQSTTAPAYNNSTGRFIYLTGTSTAVTTPKDYESPLILQGGQTYYLHLGYRKSSTSYSGTDQFVVNSVKLYKTKDVTYNFTENDGKYESTNQGQNSTVANSYIPIDLSTYSGKYNITVNAQISTQSGDYGYVTLNKSQTAPSYDSNTTDNQRFVYITGNQSAQDYIIEVDGGYEYYLHLGYYKDATTNTSGNDKFTINSVNISLSDSELYHTTVETNSAGQAITQIPFGKYKITEIKTPEGYLTNENIPDIEFRSYDGAQHEFTITNEKKGKVIVHHYIKGTTEQVADDEQYYDKIGENYETFPALDSGKYVLETNETTGEQVLPDNMQGRYSYEDTIVTYYYVPRQVPLRVHHYIEGTETQVPLNDGNSAEDLVSYGAESEDYTTTEITEENLSDSYELSIVPENQNGTYQYDEVEVTYYYRAIPTSVLVHHYIEGTETSISNDVLIEGEAFKEYETEVAQDIPSKYVLVQEPENKNGTMTAEQIVVTYYYRLKDTSVIVHHYLENTNMKVANDVLIEGRVDDSYTTEAADILDRYEPTSEPYNQSGTMTEQQIEVIYYYKYITGNLTVHKVDKDTGEPLSNVAFDIVEGEYDKVGKIGEAVNVGDVQQVYTYDKVENSNVDIVLSTTNSAGFVEVEGKYVPENCGWYAENYNNSKQNYYTAESLLTVDLTNKEGQYILSTDILASGVGSGWILLLEPLENGSRSALIQINGDTEKNSEILLEGGQLYTYYIIYYKSGASNDYVSFDMDVYQVENVTSETVNDVPKGSKTIITGVDKVEGVIGELKQHETAQQYGQKSFYKDGNKYIPMSSQKYLNDSGETASNTVSLAYFEVDLENKEGIYELVVNAEKHGSIQEYLEIMISETEALSGNYTVVSHIEGEKEAQDYSTTLNGGKKYYLYCGYVKNSDSTVEDYAYINNIELYEAQADVVEYEYGFDKTSDGKLVSNIQGVHNTYAIAAVPVDLRNEVGNYNLIVNAQISSEQYNDYGYIIMIESDVLQNPMQATYPIYQFTGEMSAQDYSISVEGGKHYYVYFIYYKNYADNNNVGNDCFTINRIYIDLNVAGSITTDENGNAEIELPVGKYSLVERNTPSGYTEPEQPVVVDLVKEGTEVTIENEKIKGTVIVHYYLEGTETSVIPDVTLRDEYDKPYETNDDDVPSYYELVAEPDNKTGVFGEEPIEVIYYYRQTATSVLVHHYIEGTTTRLSDDVTIEGTIGEEYTTHVADDISSKYELVAEPDNKNGTMTEEQTVVTYYYRLKDTQVVVHHYIENTEDKLSDDVIISGKVDDEYTTTVANDIPSKYELVAEPNNKNGTMTEDPIEVIYYYRLKDTSVLVHHYIENTEDRLSDDVTINGQVDDSYTTTVANDIPSKYELVAEPDNKNGTMLEDQIVVTYYYRLKDTKVIVHHYVENTTEKVSEDVTIEGRVDDPYTTEPAIDIPEKYELASEPVNKEGIMTEDEIELIYYYRVKDANIIVKYLEKGTNQVLAEQDTINGKVDENYDTEAKTITNYTLVEDSGNTSGHFTIDPITVIYYYLQNTRATVQHIDKQTGRIMKEETEEGLVGDLFETNSENFDGYVLVEEPVEKTVEMTKDEIVLKYYYSHISAGLIEKHVDVLTGDILANVVYQGNEGDTYAIYARTFEGYDLVEDRLPTNATGYMTIDPIEVVYYYSHRAKVIARYIDKQTGEELAPEETQNGHAGDEYTTDKKTFEGYRLEEVPGNAEGTMTKEDIVVTYYYIKEAGAVIVKHIDINTGLELADQERIEGYVGDPYETHEKEIEDYTLVQYRYPENATGNLTQEEQEVIYYYESPAKVTVTYYDIDTKEDLTTPVKIDGYKGKEYETEEKEFDYYELVEVEGDKSGTMEGTKEVEYKYRKKAFNLKVDKIIASISIDGKVTAINSDLGKAEVQRAELQNAKIQVIYTIKVTNNGQIAGSATIQENIPAGMTMAQANNQGWTIGNTQASIDTGNIEPGKSKEFTVVMDWENGEDTVGTKINTVEIINAKSVAGFEETIIEDNKSGASMIVAIATGETAYVAITVTALIILIGAGVVIYKKTRKED